jgi:hypothetical protein
MDCYPDLGYAVLVTIVPPGKAGERRCPVARQQILDRFEQDFGLVPDFLAQMPDPILEQYSNTLNWVLSDTKLSGRDKALVAFGAASATHCEY